MKEKGEKGCVNVEKGGKCRYTYTVCRAKTQATCEEYVGAVEVGEVT